MKWTKRKREEFKDSIDLLLAMTDMCRAPDDTKELFEIWGKGNKTDKRVSTKSFSEVEMLLEGSLMEMQSDYSESKYFIDVDPRTDLPKRFSGSMCFVKNGVANFQKLSSISIKSLRGRKLLSPWFAKQTQLMIDLESGVGAGTEDIVFWKNGRWFMEDTFDRAAIRIKGLNPGAALYGVQDGNPEQTNISCNILAGLIFSRDVQWRVVIKTPEGNSFSISTDSKGASAAFADRSGDTPSGRRPALRNWVSEHLRKAKRDTDKEQELILVQKHLRGRVPFYWCGMDCELVVAPFDIRVNEKRNNERMLAS